jgi:hypothetical protein
MSGLYLSADRYRELEAKLSEPDYAVIQQVASLRFVSGSQLTRLCFSDGPNQRANTRTARRALARLTKLQVLERLTRRVGGRQAGSTSYVYRLGVGGQRLAVARGWQPERRARRSLVPGTLFLRHTLAISELHARLRESDRAGRLELLELAAEPSCWRSFDGLGGQRSTLKPDSYVRLGLGAYEDSYFVEIDRGTEGSRALERQLQLYIAYHASGQEQAERQVFPRVLWLVSSEPRRAVLLDSLTRLPPESWRLFRVARFDQAIDRLIANSDTNSPKLAADSHDKIY